MHQNGFSFIAASVVFMTMISGSVSAQYYFKDIYNAGQLRSTMALYKQNKVKSVVINSIELDGSNTPGFFCQKKINKNYTQTELFTRSDLSTASLLTTEYDNSGKIISSTDSSLSAVSKSAYRYAGDKISAINNYSYSSDDDFITSLNEEHIYQYDGDGKLTQMQLIKNRKDTTLILFATDEKGNIITEMNTAANSYYYYYYDDKNRLSDVVLSNDLRPRPTPQYLFKYNSQGLVTQMTAVEEGNKDFLVWKYSYDNGLPVAEKCYANGKKLIGTIQYEYK